MRIPTVFESVWSLDIGIWRSLVSSSSLAFVIRISESFATTRHKNSDVPTLVIKILSRIVKAQVLPSLHDKSNPHEWTGPKKLETYEFYNTDLQASHVTKQPLLSQFSNY